MAAMEAPLVKQRRRIKVNKHLPPVQSPRLEETGKAVNHLENAENGLPSPTTILLSDVSSDDDTKTYEIKKNVESIVDKREDTDLSETSSERDSNAGDVYVEKPPIPAPRSRLSPVDPPTLPDKVVEAAQCSPDDVETDLLSELPPIPQPRSKKVPKKEIKDRKDGKEKETRKKKRKAAEVISSVLKRESKKVPRVATVLQEMGKEQKYEKEDLGEDVSSPWDSPPPPQSLGKVYVQHKHGFSVRDWAELFRKPDLNPDPDVSRNLTDVATAFHTLWTRLMIFSHGVVAGLASCHTLAVAAALASTQYDVPQFVQFYHFLSLKVHWAVYVFNTLCIMSCFDRLDIGLFTKAHFQVMGRQHGNLLVTLGYLICMALSLAAHRHTAAIEAYSANPQLWSVQGLHEWHWLVTIRDVLLLLTWVFISFSPHTDLLQDRLAIIGRQHDASSRWHFPMKVTA